MVWSKQIKGDKTSGYAVVFGIILLFLSFYQKSYVLTFSGTFLLVIGWMSHLYLMNIGNNLFLGNEKGNIRLSIGEENQLVIKISQRSWLPIFRGRLMVRIDSTIEPINYPVEKSNRSTVFVIPFHIRGNETIQLSLPIKAVSRGVAKIIALELTIDSFFGFGSVEMKYNPFFHKEYIIYPTPIIVPDTEKLIATQAQGEYPVLTSLYDHLLAPIGTRDYVYTDSFQRINWKASAKTQSLQTKVYERTAHFSWTFVINLRDPNITNLHWGTVENLETIASNIAYLAQIAVKKGIDFELFINLRMASQSAMYHLPMGGGANHLGKALDILSRLHRKWNTLPINKFLHFVDKQKNNSPVVIVCGPYSEDGYKSLASMKKTGQRVYLLHDDALQPSIVPLGRI